MFDMAFETGADNQIVNRQVGWVGGKASNTTINQGVYCLRINCRIIKVRHAHVFLISWFVVDYGGVLYFCFWTYFLNVI